MTSAIVNCLTGAFIARQSFTQERPGWQLFEQATPSFLEWASFSAMASCSAVARGGSVSWFGGEDKDAGGVDVAGSGCPLTLEGGGVDVGGRGGQEEGE